MKTGDPKVARSFFSAFLDLKRIQLGFLPLLCFGLSQLGVSEKRMAKTRTP